MKFDDFQRSQTFADMTCPMKVAYALLLADSGDRGISYKKISEYLKDHLSSEEVDLGLKNLEDSEQAKGCMKNKNGKSEIFYRLYRSFRFSLLREMGSF
jgi:hypothetical protein